MDFLHESTVSCPYCGERLEVLVDQQEAGDQYTEDCQVCCRPIVFNVGLDEMDQVVITVNSEDDAY